MSVGFSPVSSPSSAVSCHSLDGLPGDLQVRLVAPLLLGLHVLEHVVLLLGLAVLEHDAELLGPLLHQLHVVLGPDLGFLPSLEY